MFSFVFYLFIFVYLFQANSADSACVAVRGITSLDELCLLVSLHKPITE